MGHKELTENERIEESIAALEEAQQAARRDENPLGDIGHALAHLKTMKSRRNNGR